MREASSRARGALHGLAIGDALGMPTQSLPRATIAERYGALIAGFEPAAAGHPLADGLPAGSVTDDTEQALIVADVLLEGGGRVDARTLATRLLAWEDDVRARGSLDLLGPSTQRALTELDQGAAPETAGRLGTTNGAAMRIAPIGIAAGADDVDTLVRRVREASLVTHNTGIALAGAAAVAGAVSAGVAGAGLADATALAIEASARAQRLGHWVAGASVPARIAWAVDLVRGRSATEVVELIDRLVGTSLATQESVPAAFAVAAAAGGDPWLACRLGASVGGDCDTIAAMAGAVSGACHGVDALPDAARALVARVNGLDLDGIADRLLELRLAPTAAELAALES